MHVGVGGWIFFHDNFNSIASYKINEARSKFKLRAKEDSAKSMNVITNEIHRPSSLKQHGWK